MIAAHRHGRDGLGGEHQPPARAAARAARARPTASWRSSCARRGRAASPRTTLTAGRIAARAAARDHVRAGGGRDRVRRRHRGRPRGASTGASGSRSAPRAARCAWSDDTIPGRMAYDYVLFPGRHHLLTRFQAAYLERAVAVGVPDTTGAHADCRGAQVVFAVTSADHGTTRRNPLPAHRREAQIERYAALSGMDCLVFPVADVPPTERFAEYLLAAIAVQEGPELTPREHGRRLLDAGGDRAVRGARLPHPARRARPGRAAPVGRARDARRRPADARAAPRQRAAVGALRAARPGAPRARRPAAHRRGRADRDARLQHLRARLRHRRRAQVGAAARRRAARAGSSTSAAASARCCTRSPPTRRFAESDLYGIEAARPLFDECVHRRGQGAFANPNTFFFQRTIGQGALFPPASVDTTLTVALCHELYSYLGEATLRGFMAATREHTVPGGVWIDLDVCGPADGDRVIWMELHDERESWERFVADWIPERIDYELREERYVETKLRWAMEWLSKKDYTDNWESEMHEAFCFWGYADYERAAREAGFELAPGSHGFTNPWLVEHRFAPVATLRPGGRARAPRCRGPTRTCGSSPGGPRRDPRRGAGPGVRGAGGAVAAAAVGAGVRPAGLGAVGRRRRPRRASTREGGPTWKPLSVLGHDAAGAAGPRRGAACGRRSGGWAGCSRSRAPTRSGSGWPGRLAGVVAALVMALSPWWLLNTALGNSEGWLAAAVLWARARAPRRAPRARRSRSASPPGLLRPEVWPFLGLYGLWLWREGDRVAPALGSPRSASAGCCPTRSATEGLFAAGRHGARDRLARARRSSPTCRSSPCCGTPSSSSASWPRRSPSRRSCRGGARGRSCARWRSPALAYVLIVAVSSQAGFAGNPRYLVPAEALFCVLAGVGAARLGRFALGGGARRRAGDHAGGPPAPRPGLDRLARAAARSSSTSRSRARAACGRSSAAATCSRATTGGRSSPRAGRRHRRHRRADATTPACSCAAPPRTAAPLRAGPHPGGPTTRRVALPGLGDLDHVPASLIGWAHGRRSGHQGLDPRHRRRHAARAPVAHRGRA